MPRAGRSFPLRAIIVRPRRAAAVSFTLPVLEFWQVNGPTLPTTVTSPNTVTPAANSVLVAMMSTRNEAAATPTATGYGLTWTRQLTKAFDSGDSLYVFTASTGSSPSNAAFAVNFGADSADDFACVVYQVSGATAAYVQVASANNDPSSTPAATFGAAPASTSYIFGIVGRDTNLFTTEPSGYTETYDVLTTGMSFESVYIASGGSTTVTWGAATTVWGAAIVEVAPSTGGPITLNPPSGSHTWAGTAPAFLSTLPVAAGAVSFSGTAPQLQQTIPVTAGSHTWAGVAPQLRQTVPVTAGAHVWAGVAPALNITLNISLSAPAGAHTWAGTAPQFTQTVPVTAGSHVWASTAPGFTIGMNLPVPAGAHTWAGTAPTFSFTLNAPAGAHVWAGTAPSITTVLSWNVTAGSATWAGTAPQFQSSIGVTAGAHTWAGVAPQMRQTVPVVAGAVVFAGVAPQMKTTWVGTPAGAHAWAAVAPALTQVWTAFPQAGSHTWAGTAPSIAGTILFVQHVEFTSNSIPGQIRRR